MLCEWLRQKYLLKYQSCIIALLIEIHQNQHDSWTDFNVSFAPMEYVCQKCVTELRSYLKYHIRIANKICSVRELVIFWTLTYHVTRGEGWALYTHGKMTSSPTFNVWLPTSENKTGRDTTTTCNKERDKIWSSLQTCDRLIDRLID